MSKKRRTPVPADPLYPLVDCHAHLDMCGAEDPESVRAIVQRAADEGVAAVINISCHVNSLDTLLMSLEADPRVWGAVAQHPMHAHEIDDEGLARLAEVARHPRVVAIGETGLDYYWIAQDPENIAPQPVQEEMLRWHIDLCKELDKPLQIHNREADEDLLRILDDAGAPDKTVIHCFSSTTDFAQECAERGFYIHLGGAATFKANEELREVAITYPADKLLLETDAPFMMPVPFRGNPNEPQYIAYTAYSLADARQQHPAEFAAMTTDNACRFYGLDLAAHADN